VRGFDFGTTDEQLQGHMSAAGLGIKLAVGWGKSMIGGWAW